LSISFFTTGLVLHGKLIFWEDHLQRLERSFDWVKLRAPEGWKTEVLERLTDLIQVKEKAQRFRISFDTQKSTFSVQLQQLDEFPQGPKKARTAQIASPDWYCKGVKAEDRATYQQARNSVSAEDGELVLMVDPVSGHILEWDIGNVIVWKDGVWFFTPDQLSGLAGVARKRFVEYLRTQNEQLRFQTFGADLFQRGAVLLCSNASRLVFPISELDDLELTLPQGKVSERISGFIHFSLAHDSSHSL
jgi:branched-subunit amino acid aminotransferase/4-amino-4-deoxychorismate lyase